MKMLVSGADGQLRSKPKELLSQKGHEDVALVRKELNIIGVQAVGGVRGSAPQSRL